MTILEQVAATYSRFRPTSPADFFGLCLAHHLGDEIAAAHYASLTSQAGEDALLVAYARAKKHVLGGENLPLRFHEELKHMNGASSDSPGKLMALRVERRTVAAAVFIGTHLDFTQALELSSIPAKAEASMIGFLAWLGQTIDCESVALEVETHEEIRRGVLNACAKSYLRSRGSSLWEIPKHELLPRFGIPPPATRKELRQIICSIWPILDPEKKGILDAAALGLYVQTERLFSN